MGGCGGPPRPHSPAGEGTSVNTCWVLPQDGQVPPPTLLHTRGADVPAGPTGAAASCPPAPQAHQQFLVPSPALSITAPGCQSRVAFLGSLLDSVPLKCGDASNPGPSSLPSTPLAKHGSVRMRAQDLGPKEWEWTVLSTELGGNGMEARRDSPDFLVGLPAPGGQAGSTYLLRTCPPAP